MVDPDGVLQFANAAAERVLGLDPKAQVGVPVWDYLHPDDHEAAVWGLNEAMRSTGFHHPVEMRAPHADGGWVECEVSSTTVERDDGLWLVLSFRQAAERDEVIERRRRIEQIIRTASLECAVASWHDAVDVCSGLLGDLAEVVGAVLIELAWQDREAADPLRVGLRWPSSPGEQLPGRHFTPLWGLQDDAGMHFCAQLDELPASAEADWFRRSGYQAVVEIPLSAEPGAAVLRIALGSEWLRWDDVNYDLVSMLALLLIGTMRRCDAQAELLYQARTDALTGLLNRGELYRRLDELLARRRMLSEGQRHRDGWVGELGVVYCDLDGFKEVNDRSGHAAGDLLLMELATELRQCVRDADLVSRVGGDEFVLVYPELESSAAFEEVVNRLRRRVAAIEVDGEPLRMSIGAVLADDSMSLDDLIKSADEAMYVEKRRTDVDEVH